MKESTKFEARQLPLVLGKVAGGILAVAGFGCLVFISTRPPIPTTFSIVSYAIAGIVGIAVFVFCSRAMASRSGKEAPETEGGKQAGSKVLPWVILLVLAAVFIVIMLLYSP